jgi:predicted outer membrane repeat protein
MNSGAILDCRCVLLLRIPSEFYVFDCRDFGRVFSLGLGQSIRCHRRSYRVAASLSICFRATNLTLLGGFVSYGGVVWARDCAPVFTSCTFLNSSSQLGGAVLCDGGCRFSTVRLRSSPMCHSSVSATFIDCSFLYNRATRGGAVYGALSSSVTIKNSIFKNNR